MSTLWGAFGIYAEAIVAHVAYYTATCDVIFVYASALYATT